MFKPNAAEVVNKVRRAFDSGRTRDLAWRKQQIRALIRMLNEKSEQICQASKVLFVPHFAPINLVVL